MDGRNCNIIVYGPTSTGKTYTMQGDVQVKNQELMVRGYFEQMVKDEREALINMRSRRRHPEVVQVERREINIESGTEAKGLIPRVIDYLFDSSK